MFNLSKLWGGKLLRRLQITLTQPSFIELAKNPLLLAYNQKHFVTKSKFWVKTNNARSKSWQLFTCRVKQEDLEKVDLTVSEDKRYSTVKYFVLLFPSFLVSITCISFSFGPPSNLWKYQGISNRIPKYMTMKAFAKLYSLCCLNTSHINSGHTPYSCFSEIILLHFYILS